MVSMLLGIIYLGHTLTSIEKVASKPPLPVFKVSYASGLETEKLKVGEQKLLQVDIENTGDDLAEDMHIFIHFPEGFNLKPEPKYGYIIAPQGTKDKNYPNHVAAVYYNQEVIHIDVRMGLFVSIEAPKKEGTYTIPIELHERKLGTTKYKLAIEVTS